MRWSLFVGVSLALSGDQISARLGSTARRAEDGTLILAFFPTGFGEVLDAYVSALRDCRRYGKKKKKEKEQKPVV